MIHFIRMTKKLLQNSRCYAILYQSATISRYSSVVERQLPKLNMRVRFPLPAPQRKTRRRSCLSFWRSGWDSNPRALADNLISSQARYDHFDTAADRIYTLGTAPAVLGRGRSVFIMAQIRFACKSDLLLFPARKAAAGRKRTRFCIHIPPFFIFLRLPI